MAKKKTAPKTRGGKARREACIKILNEEPEISHEDLGKQIKTMGFTVPTPTSWDQYVYRLKREMSEDSSTTNKTTGVSLKQAKEICDAIGDTETAIRVLDQLSRLDLKEAKEAIRKWAAMCDDLGQENAVKALEYM